MTARSDNAACGCCAGIQSSTPESLWNAPGLSAIGYRVGRHSTFMNSMLGALSSSNVPALAGLGTRDGTDPTIAIADGLATMADILTFYQERIANEAFLRTATERRSVVELSRLLGYQPDPGVAASVALAFTVERQLTNPPQPTMPVRIPVGSKVQSVPGPDETPFTFETSEAIDARVEWNAIPVQRSRRQHIAFGQRQLVLEGTGHQLAAGDIILIVGNERAADAGSERWDIRLLREVSPDDTLGITRIAWREGLGSVVPRVEPAADRPRAFVFRQRASVFGHNAPDPRMLSSTGTSLSTLADLRTGEWNGYGLSSRSLDLDQPYQKVAPGTWLALVSDAITRSRRASSLPGYAELYGIDSVAFPSVSAFALASKVTRVGLDTDEHISWFGRRDTLVLAQSEPLPLASEPVLAPVYGREIVLDAVTDDLNRGQTLAISGAAAYLLVADSGLSLQLALDDGTRVPLTPGDRLRLLAPPDRGEGRGGRTKLHPEALEVAVVEGDSTPLLWRLADRDGRAGIVEAPARAFRFGAATAQDPVYSEIVRIGMAADAVASDRDHTTVILDGELNHPYDRRTARINANVAAATHGETVSEILGSGDASTPGQFFVLKQAPLTWIGAPTPTGRQSTLEVRIDDTRWAGRRTLFAAGEKDRVYALRTDDDGSTLVQFGDGVEGARLPTGRVNARATYRKGLGGTANVRTGQLTTLLSRPLGVTAVTNPSPAEGGEDPEGTENARQNAPLTVLTLDRAVSRRDYEDLARAFAGITKAQAAWFSTAEARGIVLTVAGPDGAPVPKGSPTHIRLSEALHSAGDPRLPLSVHTYRPVKFRLEIGLTVRGDADVDKVVTQARESILSAFSWESRDFGQPATIDEVVAVIHRITTVVAVDVNVLRRHDQTSPPVQTRLASARATWERGTVMAAELLTVDPETLRITVTS